MPRGRGTRRSASAGCSAACSASRAAESRSKAGDGRAGRCARAEPGPSAGARPGRADAASAGSRARGTLGGERRQQDLSPVTRGHDPSGAVDRSGRRSLRRAAAPPPRGSPCARAAGRSRPTARRASESCASRRGDRRVGGGREDGHHAVAGHLDDAAVRLLNRLAQDRVVTLHRHGHRVGEALPQPRARLEIREQERPLFGRLVVDHRAVKATATPAP